MSDKDNTEPDSQLVRLEQRVAQLESAVITEVKVEDAEPYDAPSSGEWVRTPSGHLDFKTKGPFWRNVLLFGCLKASASKKGQLVIGAVTSQAGIVWLVQLAKHWLAAHVVK